MHKKGINWDLADWSLSTSELMAKYGVSRTVIHRARKLRGKTPPRKCAFKGVDWTRGNEEIAQSLGISTHYAAQGRHRYANGIKGPRKKARGGNGKHQREAARIQAKLSERKTVHQWLNLKGVPSTEFGKPICLLRRLSIALGIN